MCVAESMLTDAVSGPFNTSSGCCSAKSWMQNLTHPLRVRHLISLVWLEEM